MYLTSLDRSKPTANSHLKKPNNMTSASVKKIFTINSLNNLYSIDYFCLEYLISYKFQLNSAANSISEIPGVKVVIKS